MPVIVSVDHFHLRPRDRGVESPELDLQPGDRFDQNASSVGGVGHAANVPSLLEPIDHPRRRTGREPRQLRQAADGEAALVLEHLQTLHVGAGKAEPFRNGGTEERRLTAFLADGPENRRHQLLP